MPDPLKAVHLKVTANAKTLPRAVKFADPAIMFANGKAGDVGLDNRAKLVFTADEAVPDGYMRIHDPRKIGIFHELEVPADEVAEDGDTYWVLKVPKYQKDYSHDMWPLMTREEHNDKLGELMMTKRFVAVFTFKKGLLSGCAFDGPFWEHVKDFDLKRGPIEVVDDTEEAD